MAKPSYIGRAVRRIEDEQFLRGWARFTQEVSLTDALHLTIVRSSYAHALIAGIDTHKAKTVPGFVTAVTGKELATWLNRFPAPPQSVGVRAQRRYPLAVDRVRFVGEGVVAVLAENAVAAVDAASEILVDYQELPAIIDPEKAMAPEAPRVHT